MSNPSGIIHLNLKTKDQRKTTKSEHILNEIARLERANSYIKDEPSRVAYLERNTLRIESLTQELSAIQIRER
jgi:hypothetical protein